MVDEINQKPNICSALQWVIDNSEGVVGLTVDGSVMPWAKVVDLYCPCDHDFLIEQNHE